MRLDWQKLLSETRCPRVSGNGNSTNNDSSRSPFESDYDRVTYSAAFRRLARKTQVHPLSRNDHVHNRLTHSLEVASVGRTFARKLGDFLQNKEGFIAEKIAEDLLWITQAACLAHDIGNPAFGHAGEHAIRAWISDNSDALGGREAITEAELNDWKLFEGNAQSFRICSRSDNPNDVGYIRMTYASLGALVKYPWTSSHRLAAEKKKFNIFNSELNIFDTAWEELGLKKNDEYARHPLSYLMEAADDICYRIVDVEDAVAIRIIERSEAEKLFAKAANTEKNNRTMEELRGLAIGHLINQFWDGFLIKYDDIMNRNGPEDLKTTLSDQVQENLNEIKELNDSIYGHRNKVATELGAYKIFGKIIKSVWGASRRLSECQKFSKLPYPDQRCLELAWGRQFVIEHQTENLLWWLHKTRDFIAGLTDNYAHQLGREIEGL